MGLILKTNKDMQEQMIFIGSIPLMNFPRNFFSKWMV